MSKLSFEYSRAQKLATITAQADTDEEEEFLMLGATVRCKQIILVLEDGRKLVLQSGTYLDRLQ